MNLDVIQRDQRCAEPLFTGALGAGIHEPDHTPKGNHFLLEKAYAPLPESIELVFALETTYIREDFDGCTTQSRCR